MKITISLADKHYQVNTDFAHSIAIPVEFYSGENEAARQPNHFGAEKANANPMQAGGFIGKTELGGSCNVNELKLNPHCNGTHTETIAHICHSTIDGEKAELSLKIADLLPPPLIPCALISITPVNAISSGDDYTPDFLADDKVINRAQLEQALVNYSNEQLQGVVIRTLPNKLTKCQNVYSQNNAPAFFSRDAILYLNERGVQHLIVDLPSLDRLHDDGLLTCHHLFWQVTEGSHQANPNSLLHKTNTEMAYVDEQINDGFYFVNLQMPAFINDAAPSQPVLYSVEQLPAKN